MVVTQLTPERARQVVRDLRRHLDPPQLVTMVGDGNNAHPLVRSMVRNNIRRRGPVHFADVRARHGAAQGAGGRARRRWSKQVKDSRLRGRGGAGFPAGLKWEMARNAPGERRYVLCNADEGEPGTFKDRVLLTECPDLMFEGMTIAGYAVGSDSGIVYLRGEYRYLLEFLEAVLDDRRKKGLLGRDILGVPGFDFDIRIQLGAGAYICGEETALISSCEGLRGDPKNRPPFPPQQGYLDGPTIVNNVETFCCTSRIMLEGPEWFAAMGSGRTAGTKVLSISGDCRRPGVYEVPFGITPRELLEEAEADNPGAMLIGGPCRQMIGPDRFDGRICYDDLATGGAIMIFNRARNQLEIAEHYLDFFIEESCGHCTPCRVGLVLLKKAVHKVVSGAGEPADLRRDARAVAVHHPDQPLRARAGGAEPGARRARGLQRALRRGSWPSASPGCSRPSTCRRPSSTRSCASAGSRSTCERGGSGERDRVHPRRQDDHGQPGPDDPQGGGGRRRLHPAAVRLQGPRSRTAAAASARCASTAASRPPACRR